MALKFDQMVAFLKNAEVRYLLVPDQPAVALGALTDNGRHFLLHVVIEADGSLVQMRTTGYMHCPLSSPNFPAVLMLLNELNWRLRMVKFTLDPTDGEIIVFTDLAVIDSEPTQAQFMGLLSFVMDRLRETAERLETTVRTGSDPGEEDVIGDEESEGPEPPDDEPGPDDVIT